MATDTHEKTIVNSEFSAYHNISTIDTTRLLYNEDVKQIITIEEDVIVTEYDKESGKPIKETKTKRKIIQDSDKATAKEETKGIAEVVNDSLNHIADVSKMVDTSVEEESTGGQESFGKWLGIVTGLVLGAVALIAYIRKKSKRVSKLFDVD